ncbi:MAG: hypothetical protein AB1705_18385 [Verrucomicrobiota bacterium]
MKIRITPKHAPTRAYALMLVLVFTGIGMLVMTGALNWAANTANLTERNNQYNATLLAAEAASEKILTRIIRDYQLNGESTVYNNLSTYRSAIPSEADNSYWANFQFNNAQGTVGQTYVDRTVTSQYVPLDSKYSGLSAFASTYRIVSNAKPLNSPYNLTAAVQQEVQTASIPIFQFAVFYQGDMELNGAATLHVRGRVHGNANLYTGSSSPIYFYEDVTVAGAIVQGSRYGWSASVTPTYYKKKETNVSTMTLPIGTDSTPDNIRQVTQIPPAGESATSPMGQQRYFNKAELLILVSNSTVTVGVKTPFATTTNLIPYAQVTNFINTNVTFTDQRESKTMKVTEIDVGKFSQWAATNTIANTILGGVPPNLIYVADNRTVTSSQLTGVRLVNGHTLPSRGLTVATPNPIYTKGHFNCPNGTYAGTTNTSNTKPASIIADAFTLLSANFTDSASGSSYTSRVPVTGTTVNAAIIAGNVPSASGYSGGINNLPRLLEHWSGKNYWLNGSLVCLYNSIKASQPFQNPGVYYSAPSRNINFDVNFRDPAKLPPGTPELRAVIRTKWVNPPPATVSYTGS